MSDSFAQAGSALRDLDRDRYAASLFFPRADRPAIQALWAFASELAAVRERVRDPAPGEIRLQWWRDALEGKGHGAVALNPVADALLMVLASRSLPAGPLIRLIEARRFDLYHDPMPDIGQFEGYAGETVSVLYQYGAMVLTGGSAQEAADAAGHLGVAQALCGHIRAFGYNASRGQLFLPLSIFSAHGVGEADILAARESAGLSAALGQIAEMAHTHAAAARTAIAKLPAVVRPAFASLALVEADLRALPAQIASPFAAHPRPSAFGRLWTLLLWSVRN